MKEIVVGGEVDTEEDKVDDFRRLEREGWIDGSKSV
jgi:hypothetical protein